MKTWFAIKNVVAVAALTVASGAASAAPEISIYDEIGLWGVTGKDFLDAFDALEGDEVTVNVNSPGGSVFDALLIYNGLVASGKVINMRIMGIAASAASLIAMAGTTIEMPENTFMMLHRPMTSTAGNADAMRAAADMLDTIGASLQATYERRSGQAPEAMAEILSKDTWLTAQQCVDLGLATCVTPAIQATARFDLDRKGLPAHVVAMLKPAGARSVSAPAQELPFADRVKARATAAGLSDYAAVFALDPGVATEEALTSAITDAREIQALCTIVGKPDSIKAAITARKSVADVRAELIAAKVAEDLATATVNIPPRGSAAPASSSGFGPNSFWNGQAKAAPAR